MKYLFASLLFGLIVNCTEISSTETAMSRNTQKSNNAMILPSKGLPKDKDKASYLYRTYAKGDRDISPNAMMLYEDGSVYRYSDQLISFKGGNIQTSKVDLKWRHETTLNDGTIKAIKDLLDEFDPAEELSKNPSLLTEVSFVSDDVFTVIHLEGVNQPKNYMVFNKINQEISLGSSK